MVLGPSKWQVCQVTAVPWHLKMIFDLCPMGKVYLHKWEFVVHYSWLYLCLHYKVSWCQTSLMGWLRSNFPLARSRKKGGHGVPQCHLAPDVIAEFGGGSWVAFLFPSGSGRRGSPWLRELQMVRSQPWRICLQLQDDDPTQDMQSQETCWSKETIGVRRHAVSGSWDIAYVCQVQPMSNLVWSLELTPVWKGW